MLEVSSWKKPGDVLGRILGDGVLDDVLGEVPGDSTVAPRLLMSLCLNVSMPGFSMMMADLLLSGGSSMQRLSGALS